MTQREIRARHLRQRGWTFKEIALQLGCSKTTAYHLATGASRPQPTREQKRRCDDRHRAPCPRCGAPRKQQSAFPSKQGPGLCASCRRDDRTAQKEARRAQILDLWNRGLSTKEIAARIDTTANTIHVEIHRMRAEGIPVEYRYRRRS